MIKVDVKYLEHLLACNKRNRCTESCLSEGQVEQLQRLVDTHYKRKHRRIATKGVHNRESKNLIFKNQD